MEDQLYMHRCLELARLGKGYVAPNPMVGAVIIHGTKIIGEGWHKAYGQAHAEVNAIASVENVSLLPQSTMYVSLEPCSHLGKTPPCTDLIIKQGIKKVVIGCVDTHVKVSGSGIACLRTAGIDVKIGVLEKECRHLNRRFFTFHEKQRPYVILKWAQSQDGFMDVIRTDNHRGIYWITRPETKRLSHTWRAEQDAILVGKNTVINDNPQLTVREAIGKNPIRIVLDSNNSVSPRAAIFSHEAPTWIVNKTRSEVNGHIEWIQLDELTPQSILAMLHRRTIQSLIVEGGCSVLQSFIDADLWDEARILIGTHSLKDGLSAPKLTQPKHTSYFFGQDEVMFFYRTNEG